MLIRDEPGLKQRRERDQGAGRITTGCGSELDLGFPLGIGQLGEDKPGLRQQRRRVVSPVVIFVGREIRDPEVGAQVDDLATGRHKGLGKISGGAVR